MVPQATLDHIVERIVAKFNPRRIILFGSQARGNAGPDSDVDLFIEMDTQLAGSEQARRIRRSFDPYPCAMDIVVYTPEETLKWSMAVTSLASTVLREGKVLYERH